jgi:hypothetical protein
MVCFTGAFAKKALRAAGYTVQCTYSLAEDRRTADNGDPRYDPIIEDLESCPGCDQERCIARSTQSQTAAMTETLYSNLAFG